MMKKIYNPLARAFRSWDKQGYSRLQPKNQCHSNEENSVLNFRRMELFWLKPNIVLMQPRPKGRGN